MRDKSSLSKKALSAQLQRAEARILELERMLMKYIAQDRGTAVKRELAQGQPLLDLVEGHEPAQPDGGDEDAEDDPAEPISKRPKNPRQPRGRRKFPAHLPREIKEYSVNPARDLPDFDPTKGFKTIDHDTCEELILPRPQPHVVVHKRPVVLYSTRDGETRLATVGGMSKVFPKCAASPEILTQIAVDRLHYHRTLYRIERSFAELGCPLARSTICNWMIWLGRLLAPIVRAQEQEISRGFKLHADDTDVRVQAPGTCDRVRVWVLIGGAICSEIVFKYTEARTSETVLRLFGSYRGYMQVDACGVYNALYVDGQRVECGCWSHVFRKFEELLPVDSRVKPMLRMIRQLYNVESAADGMEPEERHALRQLASRPILTRIGAWVREQRDAELLESSFKKALSYVVNQWKALTRFLEDGRLSVDNNRAEAEFHVLGVGRRNYLFWGSREGLESGLVLYGLIRSCVANGIDPYRYLLDIIRRVATTEMPAKALIPSRWKSLPPLQPEHPTIPASAATG